MFSVLDQSQSSEKQQDLMAQLQSWFAANSKGVTRAEIQKAEAILAEMKNAQSVAIQTSKLDTTKKSQHLANEESFMKNIPAGPGFKATGTLPTLNASRASNKKKKRSPSPIPLQKVAEKK